MATWPYRIYEFVDERGTGVLERWIRVERLQKTHVNKFVTKMDMLARSGMGLQPGLLAGPIASKRDRSLKSHTYKLIVHADRQMRPMLCRGPFDMDHEFTFLLGAIEVNGMLDHDVEEAERNRSLIVANPRRRVLYARYR